MIPPSDCLLNIGFISGSPLAVLPLVHTKLLLSQDWSSHFHVYLLFPPKFQGCIFNFYLEISIGCLVTLQAQYAPNRTSLLYLDNDTISSHLDCFPPPQPSTLPARTPSLLPLFLHDVSSNCHFILISSSDLHTLSSLYFDCLIHLSVF